MADALSTLARDPRTVTIGWIGTGVMGGPMCGHLLARGHPVIVHSRTRARAEPLLRQGASWADRPADAARGADVVVTMVGFPRDVRDVYFGENGVLAGTRSGSVLVDMTTTEPTLAREIAEAARTRGARAVDAPVSGGDVGARNATLSIMAGGDREIIEALTPILAAMGRTVVYQGPAGSGQHAKLCNQLVIAGTMIGCCESLLYGRRAGLDLETLLRSISGGAAACWTLDHLAPRIISRNFDPGFFVEHFVKDLSMALEEAARMNLTLPGLALAHRLYRAVQDQGHGRCGTHALMLALEQLSESQQ